VVEALLRRTNFWEVRKQRLGGYSGGMRQRLRCPKDYMLFTTEGGAAGHCEGGAQVLFTRRCSTG
jgi:hypothetical protein